MKGLIAKAIGGIIDAKNFFFDSGFIDQIKIDHPVISIGNITMGGTGKTPFLDFLLTHLETHGKLVSVVSRNYKAEIQGISRVDILKNDGGRYFGDEPFWLATRHPASSVYVGPVKWKTAQFVTSKESCDVILIDDGFQHRSLYRNLDIVLLDCSVPLADYEFPPVGRAREKFSALERADVVVLTKVNRSDIADVIEIESRIPEGKPIFHLESHLKFDAQFGDRFWVFCAIARPESFIDLLPKDFIEGNTVFKDHHQYSEKELQGLEQKALARGCNKILTTEKDWVKVSSFPWKIQVVAVPLEVKLKESMEEFNAYLDRVFSL